MTERDDATTPEAGDAERMIRAKLASAKRSLLIEKLWPRIWLPLAVVGVFVLFSAFEGWSWLTPETHRYAIWGFGIAMAASFLPFVIWRLPSDDEARRRLERDGKVSHRPLTSYQDTIASPRASTEASALWVLHRARLLKAVRKLEPGTPHPRTERYDPFALRLLLALALLVAAVGAFGDLSPKIRAAFAVPEASPGADFRIDAWLTPPAYTRQEPVMLANGGLPDRYAQRSVKAPAGSVLSIKLNGTNARKYAVALDGTQTLEIAPQSTDTYAEYTAKLDAPATLTVSRPFTTTRNWTIDILADQAPKIAFAGPIEVTPRGALLLRYKVEDDYGVIAASARIERTTPEGQKPQGGVEAKPQIAIGKPPAFALTLPRTPAKSGDGKTFKEFTSHPWAGLPVVITLAARDEAGQEGLSAPRGFILPERAFRKPLAKAVISQRKALVENPSNANMIAQNLDAIATSAQDDDVNAAIYLSLRSAITQVRTATSQEEFESVVEQLWFVATRIEDGNLSDAERELRAAQDRLKEALERGASQQEIQKLMAELRKAMNEFLRALAEKRADKQAPQQRSAQTKQISPQDLQRMLNRIENLAKSGSQDSAQEMLNELRSILEALQTAQQQPGGQGGEGEGQDGQGMQQIDKLTELMRRQQQLLDQTFRAQQQGEEGQGDDIGQGKSGMPQRGKGTRPQGEGQGQEQAQGQGQGQEPGQGNGMASMRERQDALRQELQDLLSQMPEGSAKDAVTRRLKEAERAMGDAADSLGEKDFGQASEQETAALDGLRQGTRALAEEMMRQAQAGRSGEQPDRDPFGRTQSDSINDPGNATKVPDDIAVQRAREILDEVRKRLGQPTRPQNEIDYLERLMKQF
jgi:uncharacterized protein (TIGR02302 family)